jgi:hypothetical protein
VREIYVCERIALHMLTAEIVEVLLRFLGRPHDDAFHVHQQAASEKRQGTKSRR